MHNVVVGVEVQDLPFSVVFQITTYRRDLRQLRPGTFEQLEDFVQLIAVEPGGRAEVGGGQFCKRYRRRQRSRYGYTAVWEHRDN